MINIVYRLKSPKFFVEAIDEIELDGVVVRPTYLSICQADQRYYQGSRPAEILKEKLPMALIHEGIGEVVYDASGEFEDGDKVVMIPNTPQGEDVCRGNYSYNSKFRGSGFDGFTSDLIKLDPSRVVKIPDDFNPNVSAFIELLTVAYQGIGKFSEIAITPKDTLGVWGDHAFECVGSSASQSAIEQMIDLINPQGTINLFGVSEYPIPINTRMILEKGLTIQGNSRSEREDFIGVVETLKQNPQLFEYLEKIVTNICEVATLDDLKQAFDIDNNSHFGKTILKWNK